MPRIVWPYDDPYAYNTLIIGPHVIPGRAELTKGIPARRSIDVKKPKGKSGATMTDNGLEPVTGVVYQIHQSKREHHEAWQVIYPAISPAREGATKEPFECLNAYLFERNIKNCTVVAITCGPYNTQGKRIIEIELDEWVPKPKDVKKGTGTPKVTSSTIIQRNVAGTVTGGFTNGQYLTGGIDPLKPSNSGVADPSDPNDILDKIGMLGAKK